MTESQICFRFAGNINETETRTVYVGAQDGVVYTRLFSENGTSTQQETQKKKINKKRKEENKYRLPKSDSVARGKRYLLGKLSRAGEG